MSDFRFAGRWLNDRRVMSLSGDDFKAFVTAGAWMVENRTDGLIMPDDITFIPRFDRASIPRLIIGGLWAEDGGGWMMLDYQETQTSRDEFEVLANARRRDRQKKARRRARDVSPGTDPGTESPEPTQARTGKDRQGEDSSESHDEWPVAIPGSPEHWEDPASPGAVIRPDLKAVS